MSHGVVGLEPPRQCLRHHVLIIHILLGVPARKTGITCHGALGNGVRAGWEGVRGDKQEERGKLGGKTGIMEESVILGGKNMDESGGSLFLTGRKEKIKEEKGRRFAFLG